MGFAARVLGKAGGCLWLWFPCCPGSVLRDAHAEDQPLPCASMAVEKLLSGAVRAALLSAALPLPVCLHRSGGVASGLALVPVLKGWEALFCRQLITSLKNPLIPSTA